MNFISDALSKENDIHNLLRVKYQELLPLYIFCSFYFRRSMDNGNSVNPSPVSTLNERLAQEMRVVHYSYVRLDFV